MKVAIVGSRGLIIDNFKEYLPENTDEIISGGAKGIDMCAAQYAQKNGILLTEIKPDYSKCKKGAPIVRNKEIVKLADLIFIFWDGKSKGTKFVIDECIRTAKQYILHTI